MKLVFSAEARLDLLQIGDYIARDSPVRANGFIRKLREQASRLCQVPEAYPLVAGHEHAGVRRLTYRDYLIFYVPTSGRVTIVRILHGARDYDAILSR